ncbi:hypothetical protein ANCCAN_04997 [Ancylostoma caninum]|uniref:Calcineurin-like phosphoesterase domain-containing protein n=1 Tax=Ancylostoma caninum TaxID=29170 RepID=A0A368GZB6_ANCCA|nr:hypothetical protein ANCCAN_04997 [Ancylostoma caninum]
MIQTSFPEPILFARGSVSNKNMRRYSWTICRFQQNAIQEKIPDVLRLFDRGGFPPMEAFAAMPFTGLVAGKILCMHGGLSPKLKSLDQLRQITRPIDPPNPSLHIDLLWSDPDHYVKVCAEQMQCRTGLLTRE